MEDAPLLTKTVKINQSDGIPGSGIPERTFVQNSYKRSLASLPSSPLLFIAFFTSHRSPLSECLEQATREQTLAIAFTCVRVNFSYCKLHVPCQLHGTEKEAIVTVVFARYSKPKFIYHLMTKSYCNNYSDF